MSSILNALVKAGIVDTKKAEAESLKRQAKEKRRIEQKNFFLGCRHEVKDSHREKFSPAAEAIFREIVPETIQRLRQDPTPEFCRSLVGELRRKAQDASGNRRQAFRAAAGDLECTLHKKAFSLSDNLKFRQTIVEEHKWHNLVAFLHAIK